MSLHHHHRLVRHAAGDREDHERRGIAEASGISICIAVRHREGKGSGSTMVTVVVLAEESGSGSKSDVGAVGWGGRAKEAVELAMGVRKSTLCQQDSFTLGRGLLGQRGTIRPADRRPCASQPSPPD